MPKISEFTRSRLASAVRPVPNISTGAQQLGRSISRFGQTISIVSRQVAERERRQQEKIRREQEILQRKRQVALVTAETKRSVVDLDADFEKIQNDFQDEFSSKPTGSRDVLRERLFEHLDTQVESILNPEVKANFRNIATDQIRRRLLDHEKFEAVQEVTVAQDHALAAGKTLATQSFEAGQNNNSSRFNALLNQIPGLLVALREVGATAKIEKLSNDFHANQASAFIYGLIDGGHSIQAKQLLNSGSFNDVLEPKQIRQFTKDADQAVLGLEDKIALDKLSLEMNQHPDRVKRAFKGEMSLAEIDDIIAKEGATPLNKSLRETILSNSPGAFISDTNASATIMEDFERLLERVTPEEDGRKPELRGIEAVRTIVKFEEKAMGFVVREEISRKEYEGIIKDLLIPLTDEINNLTGKRTPGEFLGETIGIFTPFSSINPVKKGFREINKWLVTSGNENNQGLKVRLFRDYLDRFDQLKKERAAGNRKRDIDDIIDETKDQGKAIINPDRYKVGDVIHRQGNTYQIVGTDDDGEPLVEIR